MWEGYKETYSRLEPMRQELALYMQKKNAGNKRKLAEMQQEAEQLMADADRYPASMAHMFDMSYSTAAHVLLDRRLYKSIFDKCW